jgi:hypothetical protein
MFPRGSIPDDDALIDSRKHRIAIPAERWTRPEYAAPFIGFLCGKAKLA